MVAAVETVPSTGSVTEAAREHFMRTGYGSYPVTRGEAVVGLLCLKDVLREDRLVGLLTMSGVSRRLKVREELAG
jgi:CBS domain-containing protein